MNYNLFSLIFPFLFFFVTPSYAYLDPGTGSMLVSVIVGVIASLLYIFRGWFYGLKNKFFKKK